MRPLHRAHTLLVIVLVFWCAARIGYLDSYEHGAKPEGGSRVALGVTALIALAATALVVTLAELPRHRAGWVVAFAAACAFAPYPVVGASWGPVAGPAVAAALFLLPRPRSWAVSAALIAADLALAVTVQPDISAGTLLGRFVVDVTVAVWVFGVMLLVDLTARVAAEQNTRAELALAEERMQSVARLRTSVGAGLAASRCLLTAGTRGDLAARMNEIAHRARSGAAAVRSIADHRHITASRRPAGDTPGHAPPPVRAFTVALVLCCAVLTFVNLGSYGAGSAGGWAAATCVVLVVSALQLYHAMPDTDDASPQWWHWTLPCQVALMLGATAIGGIRFVPLAPLVIGATMCRYRPIVAAAITVSILLVQQWALPAGSSWGDRVYFLSAPAICFAVYAYCRAPALIRSIRETGDNIAWLAVLQERLRLERDVHDFLGRHLSTIGLKAELATRLADVDPDRAAKEVDQLAEAIEDALVDLRAVTDSTPAVHLETEVNSARKLLHAAGFEFRVEWNGHLPDPDADTLLGTVLRELVTNVVRHGTGVCTLSISVGEGRVELSLTNDVPAAGPDPGTMSGRGLANLAARVEAGGGTFEVQRQREVFTTTTALPLPTPSPIPLRSESRRLGFSR